MEPYLFSNSGSHAQDHHHVHKCTTIFRRINRAGTEVIKLFMLSSAEVKIYSAHKQLLAF